MLIIESFIEIEGANVVYSLGYLTELNMVLKIQLRN